MIKEKADEFVKDWISAWNNHDIDRILSHYSEDIQFYSPLIPLLKFNETGFVNSKTELRKYFEIGLKSYPELYFQLHNHFIGVNTIVVYYTSVNGRLSAEVFELNDIGKAVKVFCNYSE